MQQTEQDCSETVIEQATSSGILSVGQPVSWWVYVIKIVTKFNLRVAGYLIFQKIFWGHAVRPPNSSIMLQTMPFAMTLSNGLILIHYYYNTTGFQNSFKRNGIPSNKIYCKSTGLQMSASVVACWKVLVVVVITYQKSLSFLTGKLCISLFILFDVTSKLLPVTFALAIVCEHLTQHHSLPGI